MGGRMDAVTPWFLIECGWSAKDRPNTGQWIGKSTTHTTGDPRYGVPYRLDRLVVLYLADQAARNGEVIAGNVSDIPATYGLQWRASTALRRLRRVAHCWYERMAERGDELGERFGLVKRLRVCADSGDFTIALTASFMREVETGAPIDVAVVKKLASKPSPLDLYLWQATQVHRGLAASVDVLGPDGPFAVLPAPADRCRAHQDIQKRNCLVREAWKGSPYRVSHDGTRLLYEPVGLCNERNEPLPGAAEPIELALPVQPEPDAASEPASPESLSPNAAAALNELRDNVVALLHLQAQPSTAPVEMAAKVAGHRGGSRAHQRTRRRAARKRKRRKQRQARKRPQCK